MSPDPEVHLCRSPAWLLASVFQYRFIATRILYCVCVSTCISLQVYTRMCDDLRSTKETLVGPIPNLIVLDKVSHGTWGPASTTPSRLLFVCIVFCLFVFCFLFNTYVLGFQIQLLMLAWQAHYRAICPAPLYAYKTLVSSCFKF